MGIESPKPASTPTGAVFLSYASQDAQAAGRICDALREAGVEVWFDQSELRGGDAWDRAIRKQIKTCLLFVPVISKNTHDRDEGYFRLEWKLAVDRSHLMTGNKPFLLPVVVDDTRDDDEQVPDKFRELQWSRLPGGTTPPAFVERVQRLLSPEASITNRLPASDAAPASWRSKPALRAIALVLAVAALAYFVADKLWIARNATVSAAAATTPVVTFSPPPHSIAVLPFVNMSADPQQEYFSEGLTEELLNSLSRIDELQVAARTSSFSFQGEHADIATVARKLNVGAVLEGSVRRSGHTVRVTTQLVSGLTGFHLWSGSYDRDLGDVLKMQTQIATAVAGALKVALLGDEAQKIEVGGTRNPAAFDAYLHATKTYFGVLHSEKACEEGLAGYTEAIRLDAGYALAYAARSIATVTCAEYFAPSLSATRTTLQKAQRDASQAIALESNLSEGHLAMALVHQELLDFTGASEEFERALALGAGNARVLRNYGLFAVLMGHSAAGLSALRRAVVLDPLNASAHGQLGGGLLYLRSYTEALAAMRSAMALDSNRPTLLTFIGEIYYRRGEYENARSACEHNPELDESSQCLAMTYDKLGRHKDAAAMLAKLRAKLGDDDALAYSRIYAQWGDPGHALQWLETAMRAHDPDLIYLSDQFFDPLRKEPRFKAIERALKLPE